MSHVEWVMSQMEWVISHTHPTCRTWLSHVSYGMSHVSYAMSHVSYAMSHVSHGMSHVSYAMSHVSNGMRRISYESDVSHPTKSCLVWIRWINDNRARGLFRQRTDRSGAGVGLPNTPRPHFGRGPRGVGVCALTHTYVFRIRIAVVSFVCVWVRVGGCVRGFVWMCVFRIRFCSYIGLPNTHRRKCVAVCCSVLQCVAVCCSVLQCVAVCCRVLQGVAGCCSVLQCVAGCCSVLQCVAVCCSVL